MGLKVLCFGLIQDGLQKMRWACFISSDRSGGGELINHYISEWIGGRSVEGLEDW